MTVHITKIKPTKIFIDKFSATIDLTLNEYETVIERIQYFKDNGYAANGPKGIYKKAATIYTDDLQKAALLVQCGYSKTNPSLRVEFNPSKASPTDARIYLDHLIPGGYERLSNKGYCTRIDITVDILGADINRLLFLKPKISKGAMHYKSKKIETIYLGSEQSEVRLCIYDALMHIGKYPDCTIDQQTKMTRIEARVRKFGFVKDLESLPNPFSASSVHYYPKPITSLQAYFLDSCRVRGAQGALNLASTINPATNSI